MKRISRFTGIVFILLNVYQGVSQRYSLDATKYFTSSELASANTAMATDYLSSEEKNIYLYSNLVRMYPQKFYPFYRAFSIAEGKESELTRNRYYTTFTKELKSRRPVSTLYPDRKMFELAKCWAEESGTKGLIGHDREECVRGYDGENCAYGYSTGMEIVMQLLIDEGVKDFGHRVNLLYPDWKGLGVAIRNHKDYQFCGVQNFTRTNDLLRAEVEKRKLEQKIERKEEERLLVIREKEFEVAMSKWNGDEIRSADVNRFLDYLNDLEKDLYFYTNLIRINPKKFKEMIWDQGPFFDQPLADLKEGLHKESPYKMVAKWLESSSSKTVFVPDEKHISVLRCVVERYLSGKENYRTCFKFGGAWRFQTFYAQSNFNDVMNILLTPQDFDDLFSNSATMILHKGEPSIKVFVTPN